MILTPTRLSTRNFTYYSPDRLFVAEASDLGRDFRRGRVYDDACDVGFTLVSHATGAEIVFASNGETRDADGDVLYEEFVPVAHRAPTGARLPVPSVRVHILND
jgi:hypothetical protein